MRCVHGLRRCAAEKFECLPHGLMGANVISVESGQKTLKERWSRRCETGWDQSVMRITSLKTQRRVQELRASVSDDGCWNFQLFRSTGREAREQCLESQRRLPDVVIACVGGGSNSAGMFARFRRRCGSKARQRQSRWSWTRASAAMRRQLCQERPGVLRWLAFTACCRTWMGRRRMCIR